MSGGESDDGSCPPDGVVFPTYQAPTARIETVVEPRAERIAISDIRTPPRSELRRGAVDDIALHEQARYKEAPEEDAERARTEGVRLDNNLRKDVTGKVFKLCCCALAGMAFILTLHGFGVLGFKLSDGLLMALITGTLAEVLALFAIVVNYLFPKPDRPPSSRR